MGSALSKASRAAAARSVKKPSWSGARMPAYDPNTPSMQSARKPRASESKTKDIQRDAKDPQLSANLSRLEPVRVYYHLLPAGTQNQVKELFESRARAEDEAASTRTPRNRLHTSSLIALLQERQNAIVGAGSHGAAETATRQLAEKYGMDVERLERLVQSVNVPSVRERGSVTFVRDAESGEDITVAEVEWREPKVLGDHTGAHPPGYT
ncbi:hypothetical protein F5148DRAFT_839333 [Russula earlei]|uniref:Uncharacterized protein n=1 Tax=Russula earlei TaxID=71964 RepID=A0ACC0UB27_9AGAM|nr:hypothetical protein F5148DRAFT_839333 [Russula earlei]